MSRTARMLPIGLAALSAAAIGSVTTALAFDKVDRLQPVPAGRGYVYYVHEADSEQQPVAGRTVTLSVGTVPGRGASVATSDANGHLTGPAGPSATGQSGSDGLVYFVLRTSTTPGENEFSWSDGTWTGEVLVTGQGATPPPSPSPSPTPAPSAAPAPAASPSPSAAAVPPAAAGTTQGGGRGGAAPRGLGAPAHPAPPATATASSAHGFPPVAAGALAMALAWLVATWALSRRRRPDPPLPVPSLAARLH